MKLTKRMKIKLKNAARKSVSLFLAFALLFEITWPTQALALTGGPSQPEVQSFEPVGTSDIVDLSTGNFNYNIPLLDVDGYPVNIAYHSGISMDQEASWVGLGWNINAGVINRNMRGLPDDFKGDEVTKEMNIKPNKTWGVGANVNIELYGYEAPSKGGSFGISGGASYAFNFNNYTGPSVSQGVSINMNMSAGAMGAHANLGLNSSSDDGLTIQPSTGFSARVLNEGKSETSLGLNIGTAFNSRAGLKQLSINASVTESIKGDKEYCDPKLSANDRDYKNARNASYSAGTAATFNFGMPTYTPSISNSMKNYSYSGSFTLGGEIWGLDAKIGVNGFAASQKLASNTITNQAYGYLYSEAGQLDDHALMDFNREKDGTFTENTAFLPVTNYTFDTYAVSGQGVGGSYRPFRSNVGYVYDPAAYTTNDDDALSVEIGLGSWVHVGTDISVTDVNGSSGKWKNDNYAQEALRFDSKGKGNDFENVYFKEANEKSVDEDTAFYAAAGANLPVSPQVNFIDKFQHRLVGIGTVKRKLRAKRTQNFSFLTRKEYEAFAVQPVSNAYAAPSHHIAEVTTLGADGSRYVYGLPAYNTTQKEVTFSVASTSTATVSPRLTANDNAEATKGLISYHQGIDNSRDNQMGVDNYYSATTTPAYAHSYLLTSVLSADYVDADNVRGPSDNDLGSYTRFTYSKVPGYKWRVPYERDKASYTEGMKSDLQDDKANYLYGEKELWYLDTIVTKNYVAVFYKSPRQDGVGVQDENGGYDASLSKQMMRLDSISLFSKQDLKAHPTTVLPIKSVHFEYSYDLCKNIPNVTSAGIGKLTLKKIYFSYQNSNKARLSPYIFNYHETVAAENPDYNLKGYDRWGCYKKNAATYIGVKANLDVPDFIQAPLPASDFPYVDQDTSVTNTAAAVWTLKEIQLPSGGKIKVSYESDDYAYVQNKRAMQMFKVTNYGNDSDTTDMTGSSSLVDFSTGGMKFYFHLQPGYTDIHQYIDGISELYFRFLVNIRDIGGYKHLEYVSGYGEIENAGTSGRNGWVQLKSVTLKDHGGGTSVNPVVKTAIQYGRLYMPKKVWTNSLTTSVAQSTHIEGSSGLGRELLDAVINSDYIKNIRDAIVGPDQSLYDFYNVGRSFVAGKSWFRFVNPNKHKLGGGLRVKKIEMTDEWGAMTNSSDSQTTSYGQEYNYNLEDGTSSGVASYEPQLGGDENPFRQPVFNDVKKLGVPDDRFYQETPTGECFFPTPDVCYSRVTVKNLHHDNVNRHATGAVVHEFYTAKDFPTIVSRTDVNHKRGKDSPFTLTALLKINVRDYLTAAQGFCIELNDMHGKPKAEKVYQEGQTTPISSVEYHYKKKNYLDAYELTNQCTVVKKDGTTAVKKIGEFFDMVADFREEKNTTKNYALGINIDVIPCGPYPLTIPTMWPSFAKQETRFRSATTTKVIQRFGILDETVATDLGSVVATKNIAYDAETGDVLLTQTTTNYNDNVYNLKYPAWWYYESMGPAYQNIGVEMDHVTFNASGVAAVGTAASYFKAGDELALYSPHSKKAWVDTLTATTIRAIDRDGAPVTGTYDLKVIRSGKRNLTTVDMATITTLTNPLPALRSNVYENVLQAGAVEFTNQRKAYCDCLSDSTNSTLPYTSNPYVSGVKGNWRPLRSYTHLTQRSHSNYDNNTDIRKDGVFTSYSPYYKMYSGQWKQDAKDWTYVSEVTEYDVHDQELENRDALGRYSSASFGYNQSMALSVAANAQYKEQGFDGFEDYSFNPCADDHFKYSNVTPTTEDAHTGRYSLKVTSGHPQTLQRQLVPECTDPDNCRLAITTAVSGGSLNVGTSNGQAPYSFNWEVRSGSPSVYLTSSGLQVNGSSYGVEITVTDAKGCTALKVVNK